MTKLAIALALSLVACDSLTDPESICRAQATDYDPSECDGLNQSLELSGSYAKAHWYAAQCESPTAWVEHDSDDPTYFYGVCGTADGRTCGLDVAWSDPACSKDFNKENPDASE